MGMMSIGMIFSMLFWIVVIGFGIYGIILLIMKPFEKKEDRALEILKEKYALGEIDEKTYKEKKGILSQK
jgi:putative membrane protein